MSVGDQPLRRRSNDILSSDVHKHIQGFIGFFGAEALSKAQSDLDKTLLHHGRCYHMWMQQVHPWLFALRLYSKIIQGHVRAWPKEIQLLAGDAFMILSLANKMPEPVREKYRKDLLTMQHSDFIFEIHAAWHYYLQGYDVVWYPLSHVKSTEFRIRGGGIDFDVECRRFSLDAGHRIKMGAMADVCDMMDSVLQQYKYWGEITVVFTEDIRFKTTQARQWKQAFQHAVTSGETQLQLNDGPLLTLKLESSPSSSYATEELPRIVTDSEATWILSRVDSSLCFDPVVFRCQGVRKNLVELQEYIYKTLRSKIRTQLSGSRAGVLYVRFTGIKDPKIFKESERVQEVKDKLFSHDHLAAMVFLCDEDSEIDGGAVVHSFPSILYRNRRTSHQAVARANHVGKHVN